MAASATMIPRNGTSIPRISRALLSTYQRMKKVTATGIAASMPATNLLRKCVLRRPMRSN